MPTVIKAGGANDALTITGGNDGALVLQTGPSGAKVDALTLSSTGTITPLNGGGMAMALIDKKVAASSASLAFTTGIDATYDEYLFVFVNIVMASDGDGLFMQVSHSGGGWEAGTGYFTVGARAFTTGGGGLVVFNLPSYFAWQLGQSISSTVAFGGLCGELRLFAPASGTSRKKVQMTTSTALAGGTTQHLNLTGEYTATTTPVNAVRFIGMSGTISSGTIYMYGIKKA
jgi:hypothetical protein